MTKKQKALEILKKLYFPLEGENGPNYKRYATIIEKDDDNITNTKKLIKNGQFKTRLRKPNLSKTMTVETINKVADSLGIKLYERVMFKDNMTGKRYMPDNIFAIPRLSIARVKQFVTEKQSLPSGDTKIDLASGQVIKPDKGSSISLIEAQAIKGKGLDLSLIEFLKHRGGDINSYTQYSSELLETGRTNVADTGANTSPRSVESSSRYLTSMGIDNNMVKGSKLLDER